MNKMNSLLLTDGYKLEHNRQYPEGTTLVFSNFTPRSNNHAPESCKGKGVVVFGVQYALYTLIDHFEENFFSKDKEKVLSEIKEELNMYLGTDYNVDHFGKLHDIGYFPLEIRSLDEGTICPIGVPMLTIHNTDPDFYWLPNYLETILSNLLWKPMTSATIAYAYKQILLRYARETDKDNVAFVDFQGHDFSMRGMAGIDSVVASGMGHLTSFSGTESLPALYGVRDYYHAEGFVAGTVPATEHSVMCAGGKDDELETYRRLLQIYPTGVVSVVSDTWDLWNVITNILPTLKDEIMSRDGKLVIRPDSGNPVDILCGIIFNEYDSIEDAIDEFKEDLHESQVHGESDFEIDTYRYVKIEEEYFYLEADVDFNRFDKQYYFIEHISIDQKSITPSEEQIGVIELLWDIFGGTVNEQGYKVLDTHIGTIYGDSITPERAEQICERLKAKGFASTNVILGVGSFTYQYNTRDTFGFAMKATYVEREEEFYASPESLEPGIRTIGVNIFKDPVTDSGIKKSAKGLLAVNTVVGAHGSTISLKQECSWDDVESEYNLLKVRYKDGATLNPVTLEKIREKLKS